MAKVKEYCLFFGGKSNYKAWQYGEQTTSWLRALTLFLLFLFSFLWSVCSLFIQPCVALVQLGQGHLSSAIQRKSLQLQFPSQDPVLLLILLLVPLLVLLLILLLVLLLVFLLLLVIKLMEKYPTAIPFPGSCPPSHFHYQSPCPPCHFFPSVSCRLQLLPLSNFFLYHCIAQMPIFCT